MCVLICSSPPWPLPFPPFFRGGITRSLFLSTPVRRGAVADACVGLDVNFVASSDDCTLLEGTGAAMPTAAGLGGPAGILGKHAAIIRQRLAICRQQQAYAGKSSHLQRFPWRCQAYVPFSV